jgi:hypothetical protein
MSTKFEQLLDYLVNEEMDKANELFHEIVVEKSRTIYENLIADEEMDESMKDEEMDEGADEEMDESDEEMDEAMDDEMDEGAEELEDSFSMEADDEEDDDGFAAGDATDDLGMDTMDDEMGGEEGGEDQAMFDIKNAIEELEAAFAELEAAQGGEMGGDEFGDEEGDEFGDEEGDEELEMGMFEGRRLREYREKVSDGHGAEKKGAAEGGIAGANTGEKMPSGTHTRSPISSGKGKPTTGADAGNILRKSATTDEDGTTPRGKVGGLVKSGGQFTKGVEKNIASSAKASMKDGAALNKQGSGYPGNNKTAGPVGSGTGDKAGQTSVGQVKSPLNGAPNRNA